jgi:Zn-dependent M28 family amino/carboxypeptidase
MRDLIDQLCGPTCAGRRPGTAGGIAARALVVEALRGAGLDPYEQPVDACRGANVLARIRGEVDRHVVVAAHFDHLGTSRGAIYAGADDNAAAVAVLVEVARSLAAERHGRGVIIAAFDGEELPHFLSGSREFVRTNRDTIDFMVCMDLVGHRLGSPAVPDEVGATLFALGGERSTGTVAQLAAAKRVEPGVIVRSADATMVPPLSDYGPFWDARTPFVFLTAGRSRVYHSPEDTPEKLDLGKLGATARWLTRFVRTARTRDELRFVDGRFDRGTLDEVGEIVAALRSVSPEADAAARHIDQLRAACDRAGNLPAARRADLGALVGMLEARLR